MAKAGGKKKVFRKKEKKNVPNGIVHIAASFNNTMISITDLEGNLIAQSSAGARGFRGSRKGTPFVAHQSGEECSYFRFPIADWRFEAVRSIRVNWKLAIGNWK